MSDNPIFYGFVLFSLFSSRSIGVCGLYSHVLFQCNVFHGNVVFFFFFAISYFSGIFQIFKGLFELDLLL